jgi:hypothetical protein
MPWTMIHSSSLTAADFVLARYDAAWRSHGAAAVPVVAHILLARGGFLQGARGTESGKATGRLQTGRPRVLEGFHGVVGMEGMARTVERAAGASDESVGESCQWSSHGGGEMERERERQRHSEYA